MKLIKFLVSISDNEYKYLYFKSFEDLYTKYPDVIVLGYEKVEA